MHAINEEMRLANYYHDKDPDRIIIVRYEDAFGRKAFGTWERIFNRLKVDNHADFILALGAYKHRYEELRAVPRPDFEGLKDYVRDNINWDFIKEAEARAI